MTPEEADRIVERGFSDAKAFLAIGVDQSPGSPLYKEMQQAALEALSWVHDDDVIDTLYDHWAEEQE
jgi:hypothetical protein